MDLQYKTFYVLVLTSLISYLSMLLLVATFIISPLKETTFLITWFGARVELTPFVCALLVDSQSRGVFKISKMNILMNEWIDG